MDGWMDGWLDGQMDGMDEWKTLFNHGNFVKFYM